MAASRKPPAKSGAGSGKDAEAATPAEKNYITPAGYKRLADEYDQLHNRKRPEVVHALTIAAAEGDRSENAEYIYRKRQLRDIDRRLRFLGKRMDVALVVDPREQKRRDRVFFGARVTIEDQDGEERAYRIVGVDEVDADSGDISWRSPIGAGLLGKAEGDTVTVRWSVGARLGASGQTRPAERELTIVSIEYP